MASDGECDLEELEDLAKARLRVLHRLDATFLSRGDDHASLDAAAKGLFYADPDDTAAARAAASRRERASVAACRLAFCERPSTRRWLATQETALFAARLRLGELELELGATEDETSTVAPPPPRPGHRWVPFERARSLLRRRVVEVARGWCAVPTDALSVVAVDDADARLRRELEVTARRLEFMRASRGGGGNDCNGSGGGVSPGLEPLLRKLAAWRPGREELDAYLGGVAARREGDRRDGDARAEALHASTSGGGGGRGWGGSDASAGTGRGVWRRGWRKRRDGGGATAASSLAEDFDFARAGATADAFNRLPTTAYFTELGADAKRVLRALKRGVDGATGRPFPLCMRRHLRDLRADRHLKHDARFQLTLFLKGVDVTADETLAIWRAQFPHGRMSDYQREHTYAVRHAYGLEGKMADYPPHTCEKLSRGGAGGDGAAAACPFAAVRGLDARHRGAMALRAELAELIPADLVEHVASAAEGGAPRAACARLFKATHGGGGGCEGCGADGDGGGGGDGGGERAAATAEEAAAATNPRCSADLEDLKWPHDYFDASIRVEAAARASAAAAAVARAAAAAGAGAGGDDSGGASARRHVALELEQSDSEDGEDRYV